MLPIIPKPPISPGQKKAALVVAGLVDVLQVGVFPTAVIGYGISDMLDFVAAFLLMAICGFKWQFILAFFVELLPIVDIFPTWSAVVLMLPSEERPVNVHVTPGPPPAQPKSNFVEVQATVIPPVQPPRLQNAGPRETR